MFKKSFIVITSVILIVGCSGVSAKGAKDSRFDKWEIEGIAGFTDTQTGCQYVRSGGYTSYTYLHGTCIDVIKKENSQ